MKEKGKRKKDREGRHVIVQKYKSFVKSKRIFIELILRVYFPE